MHLIAKKTSSCKNCGYCKNYIACAKYAVGSCIACGACVAACPYEGVKFISTEKPKKEIPIEINGKKYVVPENITIKKAFEMAGYKIYKHPSEGGDLFIPCETGGCWSCTVIVNGVPKRACMEVVEKDMRISTKLPNDFPYLRIVHGFMGHSVGGVGTPWYLKGGVYVEGACFACGCNFRCGQCQNWTSTYCSKEEPKTPLQTAIIMTHLRKELGVDRLAISGGECTLNRGWLTRYIRELRRLNPEARLHVDTNGSILTPDYIDELVSAGMTDIGIDIKALEVETFRKITCVKDEKLAKLYSTTEWHSAKYIVEKYPDVFLGIGIPYNKDLISITEIKNMGEKIASEISENVQVCVLDYRPEFRNMNISRPFMHEMRDVYRKLKSTGLKIVVCQTAYGYIGP